MPFVCVTGITFSRFIKYSNIWFIAYIQKHMANIHPLHLLWVLSLLETLGTVTK